MSDWRPIMGFRPGGGAPDWRDAGLIELRKGDGQAVTAELEADDVGFDGEDEYPVWKLTLSDGSIASLYDFDDWRPMSQKK